MTVEDIARVCHEANRAYCFAIGDPAYPTQQTWDEEPQWQRDSVINGVRYKLENPDVTPEMSHENWLRVKGSEGWTYGPLKDIEAKTHPCMLPYGELPVSQRVKDTLFLSIVNAFRDQVTVPA